MAESKRGRGRPKKESTLHPLQVLPGESNQEKLQALYAQWYGCTRCELSLGREDADVCFAIGNPNAKIVIIGEAPGEEEERTSVPFVGPAGQLLNQILACVSDDAGIQDLFKWYGKVKHSRDNTEHFHTKVLEWREREFFITNVVACRPPENRTPTKPEAETCWERVHHMIYTVDPWLVITMGKTASEAMVRKTIEITQKRGQIFDVELPGRIGMAKYTTLLTLHPSYLLRVSDFSTPGGFYQRTVKDFMNAMRIYDGLRNRYLGAPIPNRIGLED